MDDDLPQINLTPLIDVLFVVLVIFMWIAPSILYEKVALPKTALPEKRADSHKQRAVTISVDAKNQIFWGKEALSSFEDIEVRLKALSIEEKQQIPLLFHDEKAAFGSFHRIKELLEKEGFEDMDIALGPP